MRKHRSNFTMAAIVAYNVIMKFGVQSLELNAKLVKSMVLVDFVVREHEAAKQEDEEAKHKGMR